MMRSDLASLRAMKRLFVNTGAFVAREIVADQFSAVLMKRVGIRRVFGFDRHFDAMGFKRWPAE